MRNKFLHVGCFLKMFGFQLFYFMGNRSFVASLVKHIITWFCLGLVRSSGSVLPSNMLIAVSC
jgi:hypothetical protein